MLCKSHGWTIWKIWSLKSCPAGSSLEQVQALGILDQQIRRETFDSSAGDIDFNVGLLFNAGGRWSLGVVYKDGGQFELEGQSASFACLAESPAGSLVCEPESTDPETRSIKVPDFFGLGVAWRASDRLKFALDGELDQLLRSEPVRERCHPTALAEEVEVVDDEIEVHLGVEYISFVGSNRSPLTLRAGFFTDPDHDGFAQIDSSRKALTLGLGTVFFEQLPARCGRSDRPRGGPAPSSRLSIDSEIPRPRRWSASGRRRQILARTSTCPTRVPGRAGRPEGHRWLRDSAARPRGRGAGARVSTGQKRVAGGRGP